MKRTQKCVRKFRGEIIGGRILEVACGCAEFSIAAAQYAAEVDCIDLDDSRLSFDAAKVSNLAFSVMDATDLQFEENLFDTVFMYNAIGHLENIIFGVIEECRRVVKNEGHIIVASSFMMDKRVISEKLIPYLNAKAIPFRILPDDAFAYVVL